MIRENIEKHIQELEHQYPITEAFMKKLYKRSYILEQILQRPGSKNLLSDEEYKFITEPEEITPLSKDYEESISKLFEVLANGVKPNVQSTDSYGNIYECPNCTFPKGETLTKEMNHCFNCGVKLDWREI